MRPIAVLAVLVTLIVSCGGAPRPLVAGTDACDYCRMTISDVRFGAELQSRTGRIHTFDAIECLASFYVDAADRGDVRGVWVADFARSVLVPADSAVFLEGSSLKSPMGRSLVAFAPGSDADELERRYGGRSLTWPEVIARMQRDRLAPGAEQPAGDTSRTALPPGGRG